MIKRLISTLAIIAMFVTTVSASEFSDMPPEDYWSYEALNSAVNDGLLNGSDGKIYPSSPLTRAEMATILVRAYAVSEKADITSYEDVKEEAWYYEYMQKACAAGFFKGSDNKLNPEDNITRQEAFVVLARALKLTGGRASTMDVFEDKDSIAVWAAASVAALLEIDCIKGSDKKINPLGDITREEFAQIMYNIKGAGYMTKPGEDDNTGEENVGTEVGPSLAGGGAGGSGGSGGSGSSGDADDNEDVQNVINGVEEDIDMED